MYIRKALDAVTGEGKTIVSSFAYGSFLLFYREGGPNRGLRHQCGSS
jgi:hypothetical protein